MNLISKRTLGALRHAIQPRSSQLALGPLVLAVTGVSPLLAQANERFTVPGGGVADLGSGDAVFRHELGCLELDRSFCVGDTYLAAPSEYKLPELGVAWMLEYDGQVHDRGVAPGPVKRWHTADVLFAPVVHKFNPADGMVDTTLRIPFGTFEPDYSRPQVDGSQVAVHFVVYDANAETIGDLVGPSGAIESGVFHFDVDEPDARIGVEPQALITGTLARIVVEVNDPALFGQTLSLRSLNPGAVVVADAASIVMDTDRRKAYFLAETKLPGRVKFELVTSNGDAVATSRVVTVDRDAPGWNGAGSTSHGLITRSLSGGSMADNATSYAEYISGEGSDVLLGKYCKPAIVHTGRMTVTICEECPDMDRVYQFLQGPFNLPNGYVPPEQPPCLDVPVVAFERYGCRDSYSSERRCNPSVSRTIEGTVLEFNYSLDTLTCYEPGLEIEPPHVQTGVTLNFPVWVWCCKYQPVVPGETGSATIQDCADV